VVEKVEKHVSYMVEMINGRILRRTDSRGLRADLDAGWPCDTNGCEREAETIHLIPHTVRTRSVVFSCGQREHNPGGWDVSVIDLLADPEYWLRHLEESKFDGKLTAHVLNSRWGWLIYRLGWMVEPADQQ
jgi:hypothetical protein